MERWCGREPLALKQMRLKMRGRFVAGPRGSAQDQTKNTVTSQGRCADMRLQRPAATSTAWGAAPSRRARIPSPYPPRPALELGDDLKPRHWTDPVRAWFIALNPAQTSFLDGISNAV